MSKIKTRLAVLAVHPRGVSDPQVGAYIFTTKIDGPVYREKTKCPILRKCTTASVNWTEKKGTITAKYVFTTESEKTANGFKGIIDAAMAMGRMRAGKMEAVGKMMAGLEYKVKGEVFTLTWKTTIDDMKAAASEAMEGWRRSMDRYRDHRRHHDDDEN